MSERVFVIGGTGNTGKPVVEALLKANVPTTVLARTPEKVHQMFPSSVNNSHFTIVKGDVTDYALFEKSIVGHTRLFFVVNGFGNMIETKVTLAAKAYAAGVKQVVDVSSLSSGFPWRSSFIGVHHRSCEEGILAIPNRGAYVALRPSRFMSNMLWIDIHGIKANNTVYDTAEPDEREEWISPNDIGALAAIVLLDPVEKHGDAVYEMVGDYITPTKRAAVFSEALGREIKYQQISLPEKYKQLNSHLPHAMAYELSIPFGGDGNPKRPAALSILLGREPETVEQWIKANKNGFL